MVAMVVGAVVAVRQSRRITEPLLKLTGVARTIAAGDREVRAEIRSGDEIELLGGAFNQMVGDLNDSYRGLHEAKEQLQRMNETLESQVVERTEALTQALTEVWSEMDLARKVQTVLLPQRTELRDYEIAATMMPAEVVGGDYFDLIQSPQADWLLIGDVSGHGVTAGLGMMMVQTAVRSLVVGAATDAPPKPSELLARVNRAVRTNLTAVSPDQYMTISALRIQGPNVVYSGMHESILIYRAATGAVERLRTQGMWLGLMEDISSELRDDTFRLNVGDLCLLYTDGLTETVIGENRRRLGVDQLMAHFGELAAQTNDVKTILGKITDLVKDGKIQDDITAMIVRYAPQTAQAAA
jgi:serine phosphatase RsbU (regulator of sigma subunit)